MNKERANGDYTKRNLELLGRALSVRARGLTVGLRHPFNLRTQFVDALRVEEERLKLLYEVQEEPLKRAGLLEKRS